MIKINCDLCGKVEVNLRRTLIEDIELNVCTDCSKFGKIIGYVKNITLKPIRKIEQKEERTELLVENYAEIIKKKRESMGLTQKDFANKLNEKETTIHKIETGILSPSLPLARKLEKLLGIKLIEEYEEKHMVSNKKRTEGFTLGDFLNVKNLR